MSIRQALENLDSKSSLQKLFVEQLNFALSSESVQNVLSESVGENVVSAEVIVRQSDFKVILCQLQKLLKGTERPVIDQFSKYDETAPNLVIFTDEDFREFHFTNLRSIKPETGPVKILVRPFRRIVIGPNERLRTAVERLSLIQLTGDESALEVQSKCDHAFDVEAVSRDFYKDFVHYYKEFRLILIEDNGCDQQIADVHTQTIFNRFFFLYFIQKKGYLNNDPQFLWNHFKKDDNAYYHHFILPLFQKLSVPDYQFETFENIPFLNGGLFEFSPEEKDLTIPNAAFEAILSGLFEHYNFTVREDTEFEKEVAIDPEMMGTIFEKLILGLESKEFKDIPDPRRATGSFYTPKFIVAFMVKQSLLNDLTASFKDVPRLKLKNLIFHLNTENLNPETLKRIKDRLCDIKIVDPAVGSGAYAVGILLKIVEMIEAIDRVIDPESVDAPNYRYKLKKHIIENCIYGVDIQERAVGLSHLRLWLSLIVDLQVENIQEIPPLPNLDFHILCGDSLISQVAGYSYDIEKRIEPNQREIELIESFRELKQKHEALPTQEAKEKSKQKIAKLKTEILVWFLTELKKKEENRLNELQKEQGHLFDDNKIPNKKKQNSINESILKIERIKSQLSDVVSLSGTFNWGLDFFDVLELRGGFDIVIANPPYGVKVSDAVRNEFGVQNKDSYGVFTVLGLRILKPGGTLCYIMSDTWQTIRTHKKLRDILLKETDAQYLISLPPDVFAATVNTGVYTVIKRNQNRHSFTEKADNWILAADFSPLKIRQPDGLWDAANLETAFEMLIEEDTFDDSKDGYTIWSDRDMAIFAYRQKLIPRFSNHSFFIASPKLFGLMRDVGNVVNEMREAGEPPRYRVEFNDKEIVLRKLSDIAKIKKGIDTGNNYKYVRVLPNVPDRVKRGLDVIDVNEILNDERINDLNENEKIHGVPYKECYVPFEKGASSETDDAILANYYFPTPYYINWSQNSVHELRESGTALRNSQYWFKEGITFSPAGIYAPLFRLNKPGIFSGMGSCIFPDLIDIKLLLGILCSKFAKYFLRSIMQATVSTDTGTLLGFPISLSQEKEENIERLVNEIIMKQKSCNDYDYITNEQIEIDRLVYAMYNLNDEDIQEVENWYFRRYPKLARVIEEKIKNKVNH
ncbi:MAG TPA: hypothetical protein ENO01_01410 [Candidatus Marinimicrobia bacterium]|nr:hypothetical protein [Candidatus Neomarinimicrobiota bacterium]